MKTNRKKGLILFAVAVATVCTLPVNAQFSFGGQLRTRTELRDGQGNPLPKDAKAALFTSQRTRLTAGYNAYRLKFFVAVQDVRVWGQDVSTINRTTTQDNNGLMLHEAWAEIALTDTTNKNTKLGLKIGRQELVYDDQRLLGNLDWLQQARRHDAAVLKLDVKNFTIHTGFAFNQNKENASGIKYNSTPPGNYPASTNGGSMYKSMEYAYAGYKLKNGTVSFLFLSDQFSKYHTDMVNNTPSKIYDDGVWNRYTTGLYLLNNYKALSVTAAAYYQAGENANGTKISGALLSGAAFYNVNKIFTIGGGVDYTTGGTNGSTNKAFDPLYGTPHKFWGTMDYYYAASGFGNKGLIDYYIKTKLKPSASWLITADAHQFTSASGVKDATGNNLSRNFGNEIDVTGNYALTKNISFEAGYSHYFSTASLVSPGVKNIPNAQDNNNWAYLSVNVKL
jgi:hypothetical protein